MSAFFASSVIALSCFERSGETCHCIVEALLGIDRTVLGRQVAHVSEGGEHAVPASQILLDGLRLGRRFDDDQFQ